MNSFCENLNLGCATARADGAAVWPKWTTVSSRAGLTLSGIGLSPFTGVTWGTWAVVLTTTRVTSCPTLPAATAMTTCCRARSTHRAKPKKFSQSPTPNCTGNYWPGSARRSQDSGARPTLPPPRLSAFLAALPAAQVPLGVSAADVIASRMGDRRGSRSSPRAAVYPATRLAEALGCPIASPRHVEARSQIAAIRARHDARAAAVDIVQPE